MNSKLIVSILLGLNVFIFAFNETYGMKITRCKSCASQEECDTPPPTRCDFGEARDDCGRRVCCKGPGEKCGGKFKHMGICGEGLRCSNNTYRCTGCFIPIMLCWRYPPTEEGDEGDKMS